MAVGTMSGGHAVGQLRRRGPLESARVLPALRRYLSTVSAPLLLVQIAFGDPAHRPFGGHREVLGGPVRTCVNANVCRAPCHPPDSAPNTLAPMTERVLVLPRADVPGGCGFRGIRDADLSALRDAV